jgi:hypothetical protein
MVSVSRTEQLSEAMSAHEARRTRALADKGIWDTIYNEAHDYSTPYRRPAANLGQAHKRIDHLFDPTSVVSTFRGAGKLQQDLFPPGQPGFRLQPGAVTEYAMKGKPADLEAMRRRLDMLTNQMTPFFQTGEWDTATSELCLDLYIGTGCLLPIMGDDRKPVRFLCLPIEEYALAPGAYGDTAALFWTSKMPAAEIKKSFPKGKFPDEFNQQLKNSPWEPVELRQDFIEEHSGANRWKMIVTVAGSKQPVIEQRYRTKPFAAARYYRVPGETYGRGPALMALPFAKTLNKAMEITLKSSAIQMLGIWGYRPGGTFNPNMARLAPGQFWPMQATGGVMGADVMRLDTSAGRLDVANIVLQELRTQVQQALHDDRLPEGFGTPRSAAEVVARMSQVKADYVGAFGRMINEVMPVIVPRVAEILYKQKLIDVDLDFNELLLKTEVTSPLAHALKVEKHKGTVEAMQMVAMLEGPEAVARRWKMDELVPEMIRDLGQSSLYVRDALELAQFDEDKQKQMAEAAMMQAALDKPKEMSEAIMGPQEGEPVPA